MNIKHTPEPWRLGKVGTVVADSSEGITIDGAKLDLAIHYFGGYLVGESISTNNANRIVACVNAMEGIEDPQKFVDDRGMVSKAAIELHAEREQLLETIRKAESLLSGIQSGHSQNTLKAMVELQEALKQYK
jgi:hypothetical protein